MGQYDITLRHLVQTGCRELLRTIGGEGEVTQLPTEFPSTTERRVDALAVFDAPEGSRNLVHIEFQATPDAEMAERMLRYYSAILAWRRARRKDLIGPLPPDITQIVVYVGAEEWDLDPVIRHRTLNYWFQFVVASKLDTRPLLESGDLGDAVFAVLSADGTNPNVIREILNKITRTAENERADAMAQLFILSELRDVRPLIEQESEAMPITVNVENSKFLRPPIDRAYAAGEAKGKAEGEAKGKAEGEAKGKAEAIETILGQRFPGQVPAGLAGRLSLVTAETLDEILRKSLTATSAADALGSDTPTNASRPKA